jgi:RNA polymerase sigma factor (TIGR02999 family)
MYPETSENPPAREELPGGVSRPAVDIGPKQTPTEGEGSASGLGGTAELVPALYDELRHLAGYLMARRTPGQTLQATALVHEAFLRLSRAEPQQWRSPAQFYSAAAEAMRRILVEHARRKASLRRGGGQARVNLDEIQLALETPPDHLLALDEALARLAELDPEKAELVKLRFFAGLTEVEAGKLLGMSERTVKRHWAFSRAWLYHELTAPN